MAPEAVAEISTAGGQQWRSLQEGVYPLDLPSSEALLSDLREGMERQMARVFGLPAAALEPTALNVGDLLRAAEAMTRRPAPDARRYLIEHVRNQFAYRLRGARSTWPMLAHITWCTDLARNAILFEAVLEAPDNDFGWFLNAQPYGVEALFRVLQNIGPEPFHRLWREMRDELYRERGWRDGMTATPYAAWYGGLPPPNRAGSEQRAEKLLREWLSPAQLDQFNRQRCFEVRGSASRRRYRICFGTTYNVQVVDHEGGVIEEICFHPEGELVAADVMLAQKIALETNEPAALKVANSRLASAAFSVRYARPFDPFDLPPW